MSSNGTSPEQVIAQHQAILERIARKLAPEYDLGPQSFTILFKPMPGGTRGVKIEGGIRPHIIFAVWLDDPEFEYWLRDALQQVEIVKRCGAIEHRSRLDERMAMVRTLVPHMVPRPKLHQSEVEVTLLRRVVVTHKQTGLTSIREAPEGKVTFTKLIRLAQEELYEFVEASKEARRKRESANQPG